MHHRWNSLLCFAVSFSAIFFLFHLNGFSQYISIQGIVKDTSGVKALPYSVAIAVKLKDSLLVKFVRSNSEGFFKVQENAVVEDLLRKLPGIKVDAKGKIFSQGKAVDQVLVDGDEFFGTDPTMATKNLSARSVESVQVYDKKNDNATENTDKET